MKQFYFSYVSIYIFIVFFYVFDIAIADLEGCQLYIPQRPEFVAENNLEYRIDTALLTIDVNSESTNDSFYYYYWKHGECFECEWFFANISVFLSLNCTHRLQTKYFNDFKLCSCIKNSENCRCCQNRLRFEDQGEYLLSIVDYPKCLVSLKNEPFLSNMPMFILILIIIIAFITWNVLKYFSRKSYFDKCNLYQKFSSICGYIGNRCSTTLQDEKNTNIYTIPKDIIKINDNNDDQSCSTSTDADLVEGSNISHTKEEFNFYQKNVLEKNMPTNNLQIKKSKSARVRSLDTFRGFSLAIMIFVNSGSGGYYYFQHAIWNGFTIGDLVFPWFIFIMGTSIAFSMKSMRKHGTKSISIVYRICTRTVKLFLLGIFVNTTTDNDMSNVRIPGVLQRIAFTYLGLSLLHLIFVNKYQENDDEKKPKWFVKYFLDIYPFALEWCMMLLILAVHLILTFLLEVPGCPKGYLGAGGLADDAQFYNCTGGSALYIDQIIFGSNHLIKGWGTYMEAYSTNRNMPLDPEGILGTFTSIFLCYLGLQAGKILICFKSKRNVLIRYCSWMIFTFLIGLLLCQAKQNGGWIPINKNLWSTSYIFVMAATSYASMAILYFLIDIVEIWDGSPLIYLGLNSIVIYVCSVVFRYNFPISWQMPDENQHWQILLVDFWTVVFWAIVAYILFLKNIFIAL